MKQSNLAQSVEISAESELSDIPEKDLLISVLADALLTITPPYEKRLSKHVKHEVLRWLASDKVHASPEHGLSYAWVCEQIGIDHEELRKKVLNKELNKIALIATRVKSRLEDSISKRIYTCVSRGYELKTRQRLILSGDLD